jgi:hypothetical protein
MQSHLSRTIDLQTGGKDDEAAVELERAITSAWTNLRQNFCSAC